MLRNLHAKTLKSINLHLTRLPTYASIIIILSIMCLIANFLISGMVTLRNAISLINCVVIVLGFIVFFGSTYYIDNYTIEIPQDTFLIVPCGRQTYPESMIISSDERFFLRPRGDERSISMEQSFSPDLIYHIHGRYARLNLQVCFTIRPERLTELGSNYLLGKSHAALQFLQQLSTQYLGIIHLQKESRVYSSKSQPCFIIDYTTGASSMCVSISSKRSVINLDFNNFGFDDFTIDMKHSSLKYVTTKPEDSPVFEIDDFSYNYFNLKQLFPDF